MIRPYVKIENASFDEKRGSNAPFFTVSACALLLLTSHKLLMSFWWMGIVAIMAVVFPSFVNMRLSKLGLAVLFFCTVLVVQAWFISPIYNAAAFFFPITLLLTFFAFSTGAVKTRPIGICLGIAVALAALGLGFWIAGYEKRAVFLLSTPNVFATFLNLALAPLLTYYLIGNGGNKIFGLAIFLFEVLLATQSRGGYLSLLAGLMFLALFIGKAGIRIHAERWLKLLYGFIGAVLAIKILVWLTPAEWDGSSRVLATLTHGETGERGPIYGIAWQVLKDHFPNGTGAYTFRYYFEMMKGAEYSDKHISFVHNDYLQLAVENGLLGVTAFLLVVFLLFFRIVHYRQRILAERRLPLIMAAVGTVAMLVHAMVDFPFYVPVLIGIFGAYLGVIDRQLIEISGEYLSLQRLFQLKLIGLRPKFISSCLFIGLTVLLGLPAFAAAFSDYSFKRLEDGNIQSTLYWNGVARELQPRVAIYYWLEGIIWQDQGVLQQRVDLLEKSNAVFSRGLEVNPFEVNNLLEKIALHRQHGSLLKQPASHREIMEWIGHARALQPYSDAVQIEYVHCLDFIGEHAKAVEQAKLLTHRRPQSKAARSLLESLSHD
ncbi:MAG: O-antigen ligase family protein [Methylobacter sp.]